MKIRCYLLRTGLYLIAICEEVTSTWFNCPVYDATQQEINEKYERYCKFKYLQAFFMALKFMKDSRG